MFLMGHSSYVLNLNGIDLNPVQFTSWIETPTLLSTGLLPIHRIATVLRSWMLPFASLLFSVMESLDISVHSSCIGSKEPVWLGSRGKGSLAASGRGEEAEMTELIHPEQDVRHVGLGDKGRILSRAVRTHTVTVLWGAGGIGQV